MWHWHLEDIENWYLLLDVKLLLSTVPAILRAEGLQIDNTGARIGSMSATPRNQ